jgi:hypothetical protein
MKRKKLRRMIRREIEREMLRPEGTYDSIREVCLNMLRQLGYAQYVPPKDKAN